MAYTQNHDGSFTVNSRTGGEPCIVDQNITRGTCPKFRFILKGQGSCHHMDEVREGEHSRPREYTKKKFEANEYKELMKLDDFCETYGDDQYQYLLKIGEVFYMKGYVRLLQ